MSIRTPDGLRRNPRPDRCTRLLDADAQPVGGINGASQASGAGGGCGAAAGRGAAERGAVFRIWADVLGLEEEHLQGHFLDMGGHSSAAAAIVSRLRKALGVELSPHTLFEASSLESFVRLVSKAPRRPDAELPGLIRIDRSGPLPLSSSQERIWIAERRLSGGPAMTFQAAIRLHGHLDVSALERSLAELVRRHQILRTSFEDCGGTAFQRIYDSGESAPAAADLIRLPRSRREAAAHRQLDLLFGSPFDPAKPPLVRWLLLRLDVGDHLLACQAHPLVHDGWAFGRLLAELQALYSAFSKRLPSPLGELPFQFVDLAAWERSRQRGQDPKRRIEGARQQLQCLPISFNLPTDRKRPPLPSFRRCKHRLDLAPDLCRGLIELSKSLGTTPSILLTASFQAFLHRCTNSDGIVSGTAAADLPIREAEEQLCSLVRFGVASTDVSGDPPFTLLVRKVRHALLAHSTLQEMPFEDLLRALGTVEGPGGKPPLEAMFAYHDHASASLDLPGLIGRIDFFSNGCFRFDLNLTALHRRPAAAARGCGSKRNEESISLFWEANADLFRPSHLERMCRRFGRLLEGIVHDPARRISQLPMLSADESRRLRHWSLGPAPQAPATSIPQRFRRIANRLPRSAALLGCAGTITYAQLDALSDRAALRLLLAGVEPEQLVGLCLPRGPESVIAILGVLKAGCAYLPLDPAYPAQRLRLMLEKAETSLLISDDQRLSEWWPQTESLGVEELLEGPPQDAAEAGKLRMPGEIEPERLAYAMYTSGSTGTPKAVAVSHRSVVHFATGTDFAQLGGEQTLLQSSSLSFDASNLEIWGALLNGGRLAFPRQEKQTLRDLAGDIRRFGVTTLWLTAELFRQALDEDPQALQPLQQLLAGGDALSPSHVRHALSALPSLRIINGYGPTESTTFSCCYRIDGLDPAQDTVPIGKPLRGLSAWVLDPYGNPAPIGAWGELHLGGEGLARGYRNQAGMTASRFRPDPFDGSKGGRLYRSGDLARWRRDGVLELAGRIDRQLKIRGHRVEPAEIETALMALPQVESAAVIAMESRSEGKVLAAFVKGDCGGSGSERRAWIARLHEQLSRSLPDFLIPDFVLPIDEIPLTPAGKVDRTRLAELDLPELALCATPALPENPTQVALARIWRRILGKNRFGIRDDFFKIGGQSLLALRCLARIERDLHVEISFADFYRASSIEKLAKLIDAGRIGLPTPGGSLPVRPERIPLGPAQRRIWLLDRLTGGAPCYNVAAAWRIDGDLDFWALRLCLERIVQRHEILRTRFVEIGSHPIQRADLPALWPTLTVDLDALTPSRREAEAIRRAQEACGRRFDLAQGPLMGAAAFTWTNRDASNPPGRAAGGNPKRSLGQTSSGRQPRRSTLLLLLLHHIVADARSIGILAREASHGYSAMSKTPSASSGTAPASPPELPFQYADYSLWQGERHQGPLLRKQLDYWKAQLRGVPWLNLPTDRPRNPVQSFRGRCRYFAVAEDDLRQLRRLCLHSGATLHMGLLTVFHSLLHRYSGQTDFATGSPISDRSLPRSDRLIGFFVNSLALRADLSGDPTFEQCLGRTVETVLAAYSNRETPFETVVEALGPDRDASRNPIFQVALSLHDASQWKLDFPGCSTRQQPIDAGSTRFDIEIHLQEDGPSLRGWICFDRDLFDAASMDRFQRRFVDLIAAAAQAPRCRVSQLPLISPSERRRILEWSGCPLAPSGRLTIPQLFDLQAERTPHAPAVAYGEERLTYGQLQRRAEVLSRSLRRRGAGPDRVVALAMDPCVDWVVAALAVLKAGAAYLALDLTMPRWRLEFILDDAAACCLATRRVDACRVPRRERPILQVEDWEESAATEGDAAPWGGCHPESLACVVYTSGSTGRPKAAALTHGGVTGFVAQCQDLLLGPGDRVAQVSNCAFDAVTFEVWAPLLTGACIVGVDRRSSLSIEWLAQRLERLKVSTLLLTTAHFQLAALHDPSLFSGLRNLIFGGEACDAAFLRRVMETGPPLRLWHAYGPAECTTISTWQRLDEAPRRAESVPVGKPLSNTIVRILHGDGTEVAPQGLPGEIFIGGTGLARCYLGKPGLTADRFLPDRFSARPGRRLYRTGDRARWRADGAIEFLGRIDDQVKVRGMRVEPGEITYLMNEHPLVQQAAVLVRKDSLGGNQLSAYVVWAAGEGRREPARAQSRLRSFLSNRLPSHMVPAFFTCLDRLPLTPNGKLDRKSLPPPTGASDAPFAPAENETERRIARVWQEALQVRRIGVNDSFFELGGHSLLLMQVHRRIRSSLGAELSIVDLFRCPTIRSLSDLLGSRQTEAATTPPSSARSVRRERARQRRRRRRERSKGLNG